MKRLRISFVAVVAVALASRLPGAEPARAWSVKLGQPVAGTVPPRGEAVPDSTTIRHASYHAVEPASAAAPVGSEAAVPVLPPPKPLPAAPDKPTPPETRPSETSAPPSEEPTATGPTFPWTDVTVPPWLTVDAIIGGNPDTTCNIYGSVEYLRWQIRDSTAPPLVTTSPQASFGILGEPQTIVLLGGERIDRGWFNGGRVRGGLWFDECRSLAVEGSVFVLGDRSFDFFAGSVGDPLLAVPFFDPRFGDQGEAALLVAFDVLELGTLGGNIVTSLTSRLWGAEINLRKSLLHGTSPQCATFRVDLLAGFRYLQLDENLEMAITCDCQPPQLFRYITDRFGTENRFSGVQFGVDAEFNRGPVFGGVRGLIALGNTGQRLEIAGSTLLAPEQQPVSVALGGLFAQMTNIGTYTRSSFSAVPQLEVKLGYQVNCNLRVFVSYQAIYWTGILRASEQVDRAVNPSYVPLFRTAFPGGPSGVRRPAAPFIESDFWVQGFGVGAELRF